MAALTVGDFKKRFDEIYGEFRKRIDPECWRSLLDDSDSDLGKEKTEELLLDLLMDRHILPQKIWKSFDERYSLMQRRDDLMDRFPKRFITEVIFRGIRFREMIPFELFEPGKDAEACEEYLRMYLSVIGSGSQKPDEALEKMAASPESHPYGRALSAKIAVFTGNKEMLSEIEKICADHPGNTDLLGELAPAYMAAGRISECIDTCARILAEEPENATTKLIMAQAYARQEDYVKATALITEVMKDPSTDERIIGRLSSMRADWNTHVIADLKIKEAKGEADGSVLLDHAWRCLQNNEMDEAVKIAEKIDRNDLSELDYCDLMCQIGFVSGDFRKALDNAEELIGIASRLDAAPEVRNRLAEFMARRANALFVSGDRNGAIDAYKQTVGRCGNDHSIVAMLCRILISEKRYDEAADYAARMKNDDPENYTWHDLLAQALFGKGDIDEASREVDEALELETGDLDLFVLKMRILIKKRAFGDAEQILQLLKRSNVGDVTSVKWCEGLITELKYMNDDDALDIYYDLAERFESGEYFPWASKLYYRIAVCMGAQIDDGDDESVKRLRETLIKGLQCDPSDEDCLKYLEWMRDPSGTTIQELRNRF